MAKIKCPTCEGEGSIVLYWDSGSYWNPPEPVDGDCPICEGEGEVDASEPENWSSWPVSAEAAAEMWADGQVEEYDADARYDR